MTDGPFLQDLSATGHKAHRYPVERLVINHPRVATGAFHQVFFVGLRYGHGIYLFIYRTI
jgi:hypothetical protein